MGGVVVSTAFRIQTLGLKHEHTWNASRWYWYSVVQWFSIIRKNWLLDVAGIILRMRILDMKNNPLFWRGPGRSQLLRAAGHRMPSVMASFISWTLAGPGKAGPVLVPATGHGKLVVCKAKVGQIVSHFSNRPRHHIQYIYIYIYLHSYTYIYIHIHLYTLYIYIYLKTYISLYV